MPSSRVKRLMLLDMEIELAEAELRLSHLKLERKRLGSIESAQKGGRLHRTTSVIVFADQSGWPGDADTIQSGWPDNTKLYEQGRPVTMRSCVGAMELTVFD